MGEERRVRHHLVIDELIAKCRLHDIVQHQHFAKMAIGEDFRVLEFRPSFEQKLIEF